MSARRKGYSPPSTASMMSAQNDSESLKYLVAQRKLYSRAKRILGLRLIGMFLIAIAFPIVGFLWPQYAVVCGAAAGLWVFAGRTILLVIQRDSVDRASAVQDRFDHHVFGMSKTPVREKSPTLEDIAKLAGTPLEAKSSARIEKLKDWYPLEPGTDPRVAVAVSQRANVSYADSLLRTTAKVWLSLIVGWATIVIALSIGLGLSLATFLLAVALPLLPAFLDLVEFWRGYVSASHDRQATAAEIESSLTSDLGVEDLPDKILVWQERIYDLRRSTPLVPDFVYWFARKGNERVMHSTAQHLAEKQGRTHGKHS